jgi:peptide deformylase
MSIRPILLMGHPVLRMNCTQVQRFQDPGVQRVIDDLRDTLYDFRASRGFGRGIASPQIGETRRIIFIDVGMPMPLVNPLITRKSRTMITLWDDCFSFPDVVVKLKRHLSIELRYQDAGGKHHALKARGALSELLQHEIDHLDGVLAIDRALDSKHIIYKSELARMRAGRKAGGM